MLVQFRFKNHKSFYDEAFLDLSATMEKRHQDHTIDVNGKKLLFVTLNLEDGGLVKQIADNLQNKYQECLIFVMSVTDSKVLFVAKANKELNSKGIMCGNLVKQAAMLCGGNGGGRPDFAQAGGKDPSKACEVLQLIEGLL